MLRAVEDPSDRVSLVAALRSSFFGVSDRDIVELRLAGGCLAWARWTSRKAGARGPRPRARAPRDPARGCGRASRWRRCSSVSTTRRASWRRCHGHAPRRGAGSRTWRRSWPWRARPPAWACSRCAASRACWQERIANAREEPDLPVDAARRPGHDPHPLDPQGQGPGGADRGPLRLRRRLQSRAPTSIPLWEEGADRGRLPRGLPAAGMGCAHAAARRPARVGRGRGACSTWPARARATGS